MTDRILNLPRMARRLGVTQVWLRREAEGGRVPALQAGSRFLFEPEAVEDAVARRAAEGVEVSRDEQ
jgi:hypothetical protein